MPTLAKFIAMPPPIVPAPMTRRRADLAGRRVRRGRRGSSPPHARRRRSSAAPSTRASSRRRGTARALARCLVERQVDGRLDALDAALGGAEPARLPRHGLAEAREHLRVALSRGELLVEVADLLERPLLGDDRSRANADGAQPARSPSTISSIEPVVERLARRRSGRLPRSSSSAFSTPTSARQSLRAARPGKQSELHLRQPEFGRLHRHPVVARERDLETAAERGAVNRRDHRLRRVLDQRRAPRAGRRPAAACRTRVMSAPAMNVRPAQTSTIATASASAAACITPSRKPCRTCWLKAFTGGLSTVSTATRPRRSRATDRVMAVMVRTPPVRTSSRAT